MNRVLVGAAVALCVAVCVATYLGTRAAFDQVALRDASQTESLTRIEEHLAALDEISRDLRSRVIELERAEVRPPSAVSESVAEEPTERIAAAPSGPSFQYPGAVIVDPAALPVEHQDYLAEYPPSENAVLVQGREGRLGLLKISAVDAEGRRVFARLDEENAGLIEELSTAIVDLEMARETVVEELVVEGVGETFATAAEAHAHGQSIGNHVLLPREDGYGVVPADRLEGDPRVSSVATVVDLIKQDFGQYTSYVVSWVEPSGR